MHMLNFLDTFSMGVTFGIRAGRFRSCHGSLSFNEGSGTIGFRVNVLIVVVSWAWSTQFSTRRLGQIPESWMGPRRNEVCDGDEPASMVTE